MEKKKRDSEADPIAIETGARIRRQREAKGWTQAELGDRLQISQSAVANQEHGIRRIRNERARLLESVFGLPAAYFMAELTEEEAAVIAAIRSNRRAPTSQVK